MAVTCWIFIQIFLVIFLRRKEIIQRFQFHGKLLASLTLLSLIDRPDLSQLIRVCIVYSSPVLYPPVIPLPVHRERIYDHEIKPEQFRQRDPLLILEESHSLRMSAAPAAFLVWR